MDQSVADHPVTLIIKAPNQKYTDQTITCFLEWTVGKLKSHLSRVYPSKPVSCRPALFPRLVGEAGAAVASGQPVRTALGGRHGRARLPSSCPGKGSVWRSALRKVSNVNSCTFRRFKKIAGWHPERWCC